METNPKKPISGPFNSFHDFCNRTDPEYKKGKNNLFQCPCCDYFTLSAVAMYDICPVCFWEDDGTTGEHGFSPNGVSLAEGRENFQKYGASKLHDLEYVRAATAEEKE